MGMLCCQTGDAMFIVRVSQPDATARSVELKGGKCEVGRQRSNDLVVHDGQVSRKHVIIREADGQLTIEDLHSSNGTHIGSELLEPGREYPLDAGQDVNIGASLLRVDLQRSWEMTRINPPVYKPKFVGVLYTDIVNSTPMTARLGSERSTTLLEWHNHTFRDRFKRYGGRETKFTGDGFEVVFTSVTDALSCAAACQRALARRNQQDGTYWQLEVRMGVNAGEAPASGKTVYGMPLIIAARVMSVAGPAQVLVPAHVAGIVEGSLFQFTPIGARELKGIERPMELLEFRWQLDPGAQQPAELEAADAAPRAAPRTSRAGRAGT